jgi:pterin-4a-carbinolamine dehydratase
VLNFGYLKLYLVSSISESIRWIDSGDNFTTDISERLPIAKVKDAYRFGNKVNYIQQILKHTDWCTRYDYMEVTLTDLALQGWYDLSTAKVCNLLSATNKQQSTYRAHKKHLQTILIEPYIHPRS